MAEFFNHLVLAIRNRLYYSKPVSDSLVVRDYDDILEFRKDISSQLLASVGLKLCGEDDHKLPPFWCLSPIQRSTVKLVSSYGWNITML